MGPAQTAHVGTIYDAAGRDSEIHQTPISPCLCVIFSSSCVSFLSHQPLTRKCRRPVKLCNRRAWKIRAVKKAPQLTSTRHFQPITHKLWTYTRLQARPALTLLAIRYTLHAPRFTMSAEPHLARENIRARDRVSRCCRLLASDSHICSFHPSTAN